MSFWGVCFTCLMLFWLVLGTYTTYEPQKPYWTVSTTLLPWACVAILGAIVLGGLR